MSTWERYSHLRSEVRRIENELVRNLYLHADLYPEDWAAQHLDKSISRVEKKHAELLKLKQLVEKAVKQYRST